MLSGTAQCQIQTPLGTLQAVANETALQALYFTNQKNAKTLAAQNPARLISAQDHPVLSQLEEELASYFNGDLQKFTVPLAPQGTAFQTACWQALKDIPYATTQSYGQQAHSIGKQKAARAVASANAHNPIVIVIPCHRVVAQNGNLAGFSAGLERKAKLLQLESAIKRT